MILPIYAYGQPVLRNECLPVEFTNQDLPKLLEDMFATMYEAHGVGLAAPQIGKSLRIFIVDTVQLEDPKKKPNFKGIKMAFINPTILEEDGVEWKYEEGCLSIPDVRADVWRNPKIKIKTHDLDGNETILTFDDINARVIQHEYDHIEGILFIDHVKPLKKRLIKSKLKKISKGIVNVDYKMRFPTL